MPAADRLSDVTIMNYSQLLIPHMPSLVRQGVDNLTNMCDTIEYLNNIGSYRVFFWLKLQKDRIKSFCGLLYSIVYGK